MFPCSLKQGSCSLVHYDVFPLFPCSPKPLGDPLKYVKNNNEHSIERKLLNNCCSQMLCWIIFDNNQFIPSTLVWYSKGFCYVLLEIIGDPCNLIGSQQCDLFPNHTIFCTKLHLFPRQWESNTKTVRFQGLFKVTNENQCWNHMFSHQIVLQSVQLPLLMIMIVNTLNQ